VFAGGEQQPVWRRLDRRLVGAALGGVVGFVLAALLFGRACRPRRHPILPGQRHEAAGLR